jgi:hypothetical protein
MKDNKIISEEDDMFYYEFTENNNCQFSFEHVHKSIAVRF